MIDQSFWLFLSTEQHTTANALADLHRNLLNELLLSPASGDAAEPLIDYYCEHPLKPRPGELDAQRLRHALKWTLYALALDRKSIEGYPNSGMPWKPILQRARELVQEELALDEKGIAAQIELCTDYKKDVPISHQQFRQLCEVFDLKEPDLKHAQQQYVFEDHRMVLTTIQNALLQKPVPRFKPDISLITELTDETMPVVSGFLGEMSKMYISELGEGIDAAQEIKDLLTEIQQAPQRLPGKISAVILASHGRHYVGSVCLRPYPYKPEKNQPAVNELEFCYLFVLNAFRDLKIARFLLKRAHEEAINKKCTALVFEALPQYLEGMLFLRRRGFQPAPDRKGKRGRVVLMYPTAEPFPDPEEED